MPMQSLHDNADRAASQEPSSKAVSGRSEVPPPMIRELDGPSGPEPTRYGDWERRGRCIDF